MPLGALEGTSCRHADARALIVIEAIQAHATCVALREKLIAFLTLHKAGEQGLVISIKAVSPDDFLHENSSIAHLTARPELRHYHRYQRHACHRIFR